MAEPIGKAIKKVLADAGLMNAIMKHRGALIWRSVLGEQISQRTEVVAVQGSCLVVYVESSSWRQQLHLMRLGLLAKINQALGDEYITDIRFVGTRGMRQNGDDGRDEVIAEPVECRVGRIPEEPVDTHQIDSLVTPVSDAGLEASLRRFFTTLTRRRILLERRGYKPCRVCGALSKQQVCPICVDERAYLRYSLALQVLSRSPWLDAEGLRSVNPEVNAEDYEKAKDTLLALWSSEALAMAKKRTKKAAKALRVCLASIAMLVSRVPPGELTDEIILKSVSAKLARRSGLNEPGHGG